MKDRPQPADRHPDSKNDKVRQFRE